MALPRRPVVTVICDNYDGNPWSIVTAQCWQTATASQKADFAVAALLLASVAVAFLIGFLVMRK